MKSNLPIFTSAVLVPVTLDLTLREWHSMPLPEFNEKTKLLNKHIVENVLGSGHNFFSGNMEISEIIEVFKKIESNDYAKLIKKPISKSLINRNLNYGSGIITYNGQITRPVNHWFPEIAYGKNSNGVAIVDQFLDESIFYKNFHALIKFDRFKFVEKFSDKKLSNILSNGLRLVNGNQPMQNFNVGVAKWIILNYVSRKSSCKNELFILDPCLGWSGRLAGSLAASGNPLLKEKKVHFFGTDVNSAIFERYNMLVSFWKEYVNNSIDFTLYQPKSILPFEDIFKDENFKSMTGKFDIALTSPPYYQVEQYSNDDMQSFKRYPNYYGDNELSWKKNFLHPLIQNTYELLNNGGEFWLNIESVTSKVKNENGNNIPLVQDSIEIAKSIGFSYQKKYLMEMPTHANFAPIKDSNNKKIQVRDSKRHKYEPILLFIK
jgi:hypothetical protein